MRQWHQGKEGFMKVTRIQDKYNPDNSDILKQSLLKMIYSEPGGVPEYLYIDNGKDYTAKTMTGRDRNDRSGMNFDNETRA